MDEPSITIIISKDSLQAFVRAVMVTFILVFGLTIICRQMDDYQIKKAVNEIIGHNKLPSTSVEFQ